MISVKKKRFSVISTSHRYNSHFDVFSTLCKRMAITFSDYLLSILLIPLGMCVFIFLGMYLLISRTEKGKEFVQERIIGIDAAKAREN